MNSHNLTQFSTNSNTIPPEFAEIANILQLNEQMLGDYSVKAVDGRHLQKSLDSTKDHTSWAKAQIKRLGLVEKVDFEVLTLHGEPVKNPKNGNITHYTEKKSYLFTIETAKNIAMISFTPKGKLVRQYFQYVEKTAQKAVRGELIGQVQPTIDSPTTLAAREASEASLALSNAVSAIWGAGYIQKMTHAIFAATDVKYDTDLTKFLPLPEASSEQLETKDPSKGEHFLRSATGSVDKSMAELAYFFGLKSVPPLNKTLEALGYQKALRKHSYSSPSGYMLTKDKKDYALQTTLESGPFEGSVRIKHWYLNAFSEEERDLIRKYLITNFPKQMM